MKTELFKNKNVLIFGVKGAIGKEVALSFKEHGANIYMSDINVEGETETSDLGIVRKLDVLNEEQVEQYFGWFASEDVSVDVVVNLSSSDPSEYNHGKPAIDVSLDQFMIPLKNNTASQFITAKYAYPLMAKQKSGVVVFVTSTLAKVGSPWSAALTSSHAATEGLLKSLATEWGSEGIKVIGVRSEAMPESPAIDYTFTAMGANMGMSKEEMQGYIEQQKTALKRLPTIKETALLIVVSASPLTPYMTGTVLNNSGGHILE